VLARAVPPERHRDLHRHRVRHRRSRRVVSLGAFLAGLVVSESRFNSQALGEVLPLQILFSATFFVSIGLLLDVGFLVEHLPMVLGACSRSSWSRR
jgi:hypothetical protein